MFLDAEAAVDAVAAVGAGITTVRARLASASVIADATGFPVEHHALEAGIGAGVQADLLAHEPGIGIGQCGHDDDPAPERG
jgi:hypothetical protein